MTDDFWQRLLTQSLRRAAHVGHSLDMIGELPAAREAAEDATTRSALLESWLVNIRLLAEFLLIHPSNPAKDFSATDYGWVLPGGIDTAEIEDVWQLASQHLVHFSRERAPEDVHALEAADVTLGGLVRVSRAVLGVAEQFVEHLRMSNDPEWGSFQARVEHARSALSRN